MNTRKLITMLVALMTANMAIAYDFEVDGIYYLVNGSEATVTYKTTTGVYHFPFSDYSGNVVIPEIVTYQGVTYPVTSIGKWAFYDCDELTSIHIPKSIKRIEGQQAFGSCENLSVVDIESLEAWCSIDFEITVGYEFSSSNPLAAARHLFINGEELTELVIPSGVTRIGSAAFCRLSSISRIEIPASVTSIGAGAFAGCNTVERLDIPSLETWLKIDIRGKGANPMGYARRIYFDGVEMSHELVIPETTKMISAGAFNGCHHITRVTIPSSVETIGADAFSNCDYLESVDIQDIAAWCKISFENSGSNPISNGELTDTGFEWEENYVAIYVNGVPVTQLEIPEGVTSIGAYAFMVAPFEHVSFPSTMVSIGDRAFAQSTIDEVILLENFKSLGKNAFSNCRKLKKVHFNDGLEVITASAFSLCTHLSDVTFPSKVKRIERLAFFDCPSMTTMPVLDSLQVIEEMAFYAAGVKNLKTGQSLTTIGDMAFASSGLTRVELGDQVNTLGVCVFDCVGGLEEMIVGNGVHKIPENFCNSCFNLKSVIFGNAVDTIESGSFEYCENLNAVICKAEEPSVMIEILDPRFPDAPVIFFPSEVFQNATLYVPGASVEAYKSAFIWENFQNIMDINKYTIPGDVNGDGEVTIADANNVIDVVVMGGNSGHTRVPAADVNGDGEVNIGDINAIIDMILSRNALRE